MNKKIILAAVAVLAIVVVAGAFLISGGSGEKSLTIVSFGGAYQAAQRDAYMTSFTQQTGIPITEGEYNGEYGLLKERCSVSQGTWDVVSVESAPTLRGSKEGLFATIPSSVFEGLDVIPAARRENAAGHLVFATILAYQSDLEKPPASWKDFWDVAKLPGKRGLRNNPRGTLEIALLADGVEMDELYPLDVDRAFRALDRIREHVVFWESGAQPIQLLANNVVVMSSVYNGRIWNAKTNEHLKVDWTTHGGLLEVEYWVVPKNSPNVGEAMKFIRHSLMKKQQAAFSNQIAYAPVNLSAMTDITENVREALPDLGKPELGQGVVNAEWWSTNEAEVSARWEAWQSAN